MMLFDVVDDVDLNFKGKSDFLQNFMLLFVLSYVLCECSLPHTEVWE